MTMNHILLSTEIANSELSDIELDTEDFNWSDSDRSRSSSDDDSQNHSDESEADQEPYFLGVIFILFSILA